MRLHVSEWGNPEAPPVLLCHGMFDHGRGFDLLAPRLADRFWVLALDARGHGESGWADAYLWPLDVLDIVNVLRAIGRPAHLVGHSKGGGQASDAAVLAPDLVRKVVNMDGFGPPDDRGFGPNAGSEFASLTLPERCGLYLDRRRTAADRLAWRPYPSFDDLLARRREQNPRLSESWLRYFAYHAARESDDGWRWKADPQTTAGGFGPFKSDWIGPAWKQLCRPMLAITGSEPDIWGPLPEEVLSQRLCHVPDLERATVEGAGHFMHMERPGETADLLDDFLDVR